MEERRCATYDADAGLPVTLAGAIVAVARLGEADEVQDVPAVQVVRLELAVVALRRILPTGRERSDQVMHDKRAPGKLGCPKSSFAWKRKKKS